METFALIVLLIAQWPTDDDIIMRGDANNDGQVDVSDAGYISAFLYSGGPEPPCMNQADANHDGQVDGSDPVFISAFLFNGGDPPPDPGPWATECSHTDPWISCDDLGACQ